MAGRSLSRSAATGYRWSGPLRGELGNPHPKGVMLQGLAVPKFPLMEAELHLALGTTIENTFSDGTRRFFDQCEELLSLQRGKPVRILTPLITMTKADVIGLSDQETLGLSFSCVHPVNNQHCGLCIKCGGRRAAFLASGVNDPTDYAHA